MRRLGSGVSTVGLLLLAAVHARGASEYVTPATGEEQRLLTESVNPGWSPSALSGEQLGPWASRFTLYDPPALRAELQSDDRLAGGGAPFSQHWNGSSSLEYREISSYPAQFFNGFKLVAGAELALLGVMMALPKEVTKWQDDFVQDAMRNLGEAYTSPPVWDQDDWALNYVGHPYAGSIYYNCVRAQGGTVFGSFMFGLFASTMWEYFVEAVAERPSTQDLIVTPVTGAILGELTHQLTTAMKKNGTTFPEKVVITVLNPASVIFRGYH